MTVDPQNLTPLAPVIPGPSGSLPELKINRGTIQIYRVFDIAEEVDLRKVEQILSQQRGGETRLRLAKAGQAVVMRNAPVRLSLGELDLKLPKGTFRADTTATVWDYGVVS